MSYMNPLSFALNHQRDIHEVEGRTADDAVAFFEIRDVLKKHGLEKKYGLSLLHKHFDLCEDEILVEYTDIEKRRLTLMPMKVGNDKGSNGHLIETTWSLDTDIEACGVCVNFCYSSSTGQHARPHEVR